ncbi:MAG: PIN domain-containing protein [Spirochaetales bacterium]|nr:PIN domain-containing protein [Spirochaetales bacterium]
MYYLDTNTCIYYLNNRFPELRKRLLSHRPADRAVPALVKAELLYGALKSRRRDENVEIVRQFLRPFDVVKFGDVTVEHYAEIRDVMERIDTPIGGNDMVIAAIVRFREGTLVTHNTSEFRRVPNLGVEDWTTAESAGNSYHAFSALRVEFRVRESSIK